MRENLNNKKGFAMFIVIIFVAVVIIILSIKVISGMTSEESDLVEIYGTLEEKTGTSTGVEDKKPSKGKYIDMSEKVVNEANEESKERFEQFEGLQ